MKVSSLIENFNPLYLEDLRALTHPSRFIVEDHYQILILRVLKVSDSNLGSDSIGVIFFDKKFYLFDKEAGELVEFKKGIIETYKFISKRFTNDMQIVEGLFNEVDRLEDSLFDRDVPRYFMDIWFDTKKGLSKIERYYQRGSDVWSRFIKHVISEVDEGASEINDLNETFKINLQNIRSHLEKLDSLHHYYTSIKNDKLNNNIYFLTLISAVFLPLNLVVGFFGMNTEGLYFSGDKLGTQKVLLIIAGTFLFSLVGLKLIRIVDNYIFKFLFYRYDIYRNVSKRIENFLKVD